MNTNNVKLADKLNKLLADYQIYYQNLRGLHWNVKGVKFFMLHEKYEEYYDEAAETIDEIAERILMIGGKPLHSYDAYLQTAELKERSEEHTSELQSRPHLVCRLLLEIKKRESKGRH